MMTEIKVFKGDLILKRNTVFDCDIRVKGDIKGKDGKRFSIDARDIDAWDIDAWDIDAGNIHARDIDAWNIDARDIHAGNIDAGNIHARDIDAWNIDAREIDAGDIDAWDIICVSRKKKFKDAKTIAYSIVLDRLNRELGEVMPEKKKDGGER